MAAPHSFVTTLRDRWLAKRNEFIARKAPRDPNGITYGGRYCDGPDDYARRELRAYRLALAWARDISLAGEWWWAKRDSRWDVYPSSRESTMLVRVVVRGPGTSFICPKAASTRSASFSCGARGLCRP